VKSREKISGHCNIEQAGEGTFLKQKKNTKKKAESWIARQKGKKSHSKWRRNGSF